jgi:hypothetical protein
MTNPPEDMVERVARAMCLDLGVPPDNWTEDEAGVPVFAWQLEAGTARAAIAAMREPTEAMIEAGEVACGSSYGVGPWECRTSFTAMIDASLEPSP